MNIENIYFATGERGGRGGQGGAETSVVWIRTITSVPQGRSALSVSRFLLLPFSFSVLPSRPFVFVCFIRFLSSIRLFIVHIFPGPQFCLLRSPGSLSLFVSVLFISLTTETQFNV